MYNEIVILHVRDENKDTHLNLNLNLGHSNCIDFVVFAGLYECDYDTLSTNSLLPLQAAGFDPIPQRLRFTGLPVSLTSAVFDTDFQNFNDCKFI